MYLDRYSSQERMNRFYAGDTIDRVPFISSATMYSGYQNALTSDEFYFQVPKSYHAQSWCLEMIGCDGSPCYDLPQGEVLDLGGELAYPNSKRVALPTVRKYPVTTVNEGIDYQIPSLEKRLFLKKKIEFISYAHTQGQTDASITAGSPFTILGSIIEPSLFMTWIKSEPDLIHKLLKQATDYLLECADVMIDTFGVQKCSASSNYPFDSNSLISPETFETFSLPYVLSIHAQLKARGIKSFGLHLCGNQNKNIHFFKELHLPERSFISLDEANSLVSVANILGSQHIYAGNVPTEFLVTNSPEDVYDYSRRVIQDMKYNDGGFVLMPSCDLPINTRPINLYAMLKATRDFGVY